MRRRSAGLPQKIDLHVAARSERDDTATAGRGRLRGTLACVELLSLDQVAERLGVSAPRVQQYLRDGQLVAVDGRILADLIQDGAIVKGLPAVITLLRDARYRDNEIVDWLMRGDPSLPGRAIDALRENRGREVKRRAQAAGF